MSMAPLKAATIRTDAHVGTQVIVVRDDRTILHTQTRTPPWQLGDGTWVVSVEGISGCYSLNRVFVDLWRVAYEAGEAAGRVTP